MPTHERADAVATNLPAILGVRHIDEIVVVLDGPSPPTLRVLEAAGDGRLQTLQLPARQGAPTARNAGMAMATGEWVVMAEDDCRFPRDYVSVLLGEADRLGADIVGAPWVYAPEHLVAELVAQRRRDAVDKLCLGTHPSTFPRGAVETPFMPNLALIRRAVLEDVRFDPGYRANAWREETAFYVSAMRAGYRCYLSDATFSYQIAHWQGGQHTGRFAYEYWVMRNDIRFLRHHGSWLRQQGLLDDPRLEHLRLLSGRWYAIVRAAVRARRARLMGDGGTH